MQDSYDIVIIGAGAAGIAAGRTLAQSGRSFVILEARDRIGGRTWSVVREGIALDLGGGWLHAGARNYWRKTAEHEGIALDTSSAPWERRDQTMRTREQALFGTAFARFHERIDEAEKYPDRPASDYLVPGDPANPMIDAVCTYLNGVTLDHVSAHDYIRYDGDGGNQRAPMGYGGLITMLANGLPIDFETQATLIDHSGVAIRIETNRGALNAKAVIVTIPTPLIANETLRFSPALPNVIDLAGGLPLGTVDKAFFGFDDADVPEGAGRMFGRRPGKPNYDFRPLGRPVVEAFIAGPVAEEFERIGPAAAQDYLLEDLASVLGADMRKKIRPLAASSWGKDPLSLGSYSYAKPSYAEARLALSEPVTERIFIAGEALAPAFFGTAHGAAETAVTATERALAALDR